MHGHAIHQEKEATKIFTENSSEQAPHSASQSGIGYKSPAHFGALIAAKPRILDMIRDATTAGILPEQPLLARLSALMESATAAFFDALDDDAERPTARLYLQKAAQAADEYPVATPKERSNR